MPNYVKAVVWIVVFSLVAALLSIWIPTRAPIVAVNDDEATTPTRLEGAIRADESGESGASAGQNSDSRTEMVGKEDASSPHAARVIRVFGKLTIAAQAEPLPGCSVFVRMSGTVLSGDTTGDDGEFTVGAPLPSVDRPAGVSLDVRFGESVIYTRKVQPDEFQLGAGAGSWDLALDLRIDATLVRGVIVDEDASPIVGGGVALIQGGERSETLRQLVRVATSADGAFSIIATPSTNADGLLVSAGGFAPTLVPRSIAGGSLVDFGTIALNRGVSIRGRVVSSFPIEERAPTVLAQIEIGGQIMSDTITGQLWWSDGQLYQGSESAQVSADGTFELTGLARADYRIELRRAKHASRARKAQSVQRVTAPADGVELFDRGALIKLQPRDRVTKEPIRTNNMMVRVEGETWLPGGWAAADYGEPRAIHFDAFAEFKGVASIVGYRDIEFAFVAPAEGQTLSRDIYFDAIPEFRDVMFRVVTEDGDPVRRISAAIKWAGGPDDSRLITTIQPSSEDGRFVAKSMPSAPLRLTVSSARNRVAGDPNLLVPSTVDVGPGPTDELTIVLQFGGLVELQVTNSAGRPLPATCKWLEPANLQETNRWMDEGPPIVEFEGWVGPQGQAKFVRPLLPGVYKMEIGYEGYTPKPIEFEIKDKETAAVHVTLDSL